MEDIMEQRIVENLGYMYGKESVEPIMMIFFLRAMIFYNKTNLEERECVEFLIDELNLPQDAKGIVSGIFPHHSCS